MNDPYPKQKHNLLAFATDYVFFALAMGAINLNTILPAFAAQLGAPKTVVGALVTVALVFWTLPQLFAGNVVSRVEDKKALMMRMVLIGRPAILAVAALIGLTHAQPPGLILATLFAAFAVFLGTDAFAAIAWFDLLGRAFPPEKRGGYIGLWQVGKGAGLLGVAALVGFILSDSGPHYPLNYALLFAIAGALLMVSVFGLSQIHDNRSASSEPATTVIAWRDFGRHLVQLWKQDSRLRHISIARTLFTLSTMAFPFYILYATEKLHFTEQVIGVFIVAQTGGVLVAGLVLGRVADRYGAQRAIQIGALLALTAPILALTIAFAGQNVAGILRNAYAWIYICIGLADNLIMLGYLNYTIDITPPGQRSIYMGIFNALATIGVLGPTIAGWLLSRTSYPVLFGVTLAIGTAALALAFSLPASRELAQPVPQAAAPAPADHK